MPVNKSQLDAVVQAWNKYAEETPRKISAKDLLEKRDVNMYRGLGIADALDLARQMVEHRSVATIEMTMGYLYERLLEETGPQKVTKEQKKRPGYRGIDFVHRTPGELRVINLKAGLSTSNGDITAATRDNLRRAKEHWEAQALGDDNPLDQRESRVVMVKAVARGKRKETTTDEGILWLVGESMWEYFGAGKDLLKRLSDSLGRNPLDYQRYGDEKVRAAERVANYLAACGLAGHGGEIDWSALAVRFP